MVLFLLHWRIVRSPFLAHLAMAFLIGKSSVHALVRQCGHQTFQCWIWSATNNHNAIGDCGQLSSLSGVYRILNQIIDISYSEGSLIEFQCVHTPYQIDRLFTTQCQAGLWNPHPRDVCGQDLTVAGYD